MKSPRGPDRAAEANVWRNVQKPMDRCGAGGESIFLILVVVPRATKVNNLAHNYNRMLTFRNLQPSQ